MNATAGYVGGAIIDAQTEKVYDALGLSEEERKIARASTDLLLGTAGLIKGHRLASGLNQKLTNVDYNPTPSKPAVVPDNYTKSVNVDGKEVVNGPLGGIYTSTGLTTETGEPIFRLTSSSGGGYFIFNGAKVDVPSPTDRTGKVDLHHPLPKFLGGNKRQDLVEINDPQHKELHQMINEELELVGLGGLPTNASQKDWTRYLESTGGRDDAYHAVINASEKFDFKYDTNITGAVWNSLIKQDYGENY